MIHMNILTGEYLPSNKFAMLILTLFLGPLLLGEEGMDGRYHYLASSQNLFIRVHENLVQHPSK